MPQPALDKNPFLAKLTEGVALKRIKALKEAAQNERGAADKDGDVAQRYAYGSQWARTFFDRRSRQLGIQSLPSNIVSETGKRIRVSMNMILPMIRSIRSQFGMPKELPYYVTPASAAANDYNASIAGECLLPKLYRLSRMRERYSDASAARIVLGSCFHLLVRRVVSKAIQLRNPQTGEPIMDGDGNPVMAPGNLVEPILVWPHQITRNPAVRSHRIADHDEIIVTCVLTLDALKELTGGREPKGDELKKVKTIGELVGSDGDLALLCETNAMPYAGDSKQPGVVTDIAFWKDPESPWLWPAMAVRCDGLFAADEGMAYFGESQIPYRALYRYDFEVPPGSFYGRGLPALMRTAQDVYNLAVSGVVQHGANFSASKYEVEKGILDEEGRKALLGNSTGVVGWKRRDQRSGPPGVIQPPPIPQSLGAMMTLGQQHGDLSANSGGVQRGELKTHQSVSALQMQGVRLDAVQEEIGAHDAEEFVEESAALLLGSVYRMPRWQIDEIAGQELEADAIDDIKTAATSGTMLDISIRESDLLPMTRAQRETRIMNLAVSGHLNDPVMRRLLAENTGIDFDENERLSRDQARGENRKFVRGLPVPEPDVFGELHDTHIPVHQNLLATSGFRERYPQAYEALVEHLKQTYKARATREFQIKTLEQVAMNEAMGVDPLTGLALSPPESANQTGGPASPPTGQPEDDTGMMEPAMANQMPPPEAGAAMPPAQEPPGLAG